MSKKGIALCLTAFIVSIGMTASALEKDSRHIISERLIAQIDFSSWLPESFTVGPDSRQVAYAAKSDKKWFVVVYGEKGKKYDSIGGLMFSPDGKRVAYAAKVGDKISVVIDGKEGRLYDHIDGFTFSPDSKRVAYAARTGDKSVVIVDGEERKQYDSIGGLMFSPDGKRVAYGA